MLCAPVFIFIYIWQLSSYRASRLWFIYLTVATYHTQYTFLSLCQLFFMRKQRKHENNQSPLFLYEWKMAPNAYKACTA